MSDILSEKVNIPNTLSSDKYIERENASVLNGDKLWNDLIPISQTYSPRANTTGNNSKDTS